MLICPKQVGGVLQQHSAPRDVTGAGEGHDRLPTSSPRENPQGGERTRDEKGGWLHSTLVLRTSEQIRARGSGSLLRRY